MCNLYCLTFDEILEIFCNSILFQKDFCFLFLYASFKKEKQNKRIKNTCQYLFVFKAFCYPTESLLFQGIFVDCRKKRVENTEIYFSTATGLIAQTNVNENWSKHIPSNCALQVCDAKICLQLSARNQEQMNAVQMPWQSLLYKFCLLTYFIPLYYSHLSQSKKQLIALFHVQVAIGSEGVYLFFLGPCLCEKASRYIIFFKPKGNSNIK